MPTVSPAQIGQILDIAEDGIITVNAEQRIILFNRGAEKIFGYSAQEIMGQPLERLLPARYAGTHAAHVRRFGESNVPARRMGERAAVVAVRKDGSEFPADISISCIHEGGRTLFTAILRDVTEQRRIQAAIEQLNQTLEQRVHERTAELVKKSEELRSTTQQLWQSAKLASVGELAASIAHELNNPLSTVSLRIESILGATPTTDTRRSSLQIVEQEVERMARLVGSLLQFCRFGREQVSTVNVGDEVMMASELTHHHLHRRQVHFQPELADPLPVLFADRQKLRQLLLNLITNAGDAMPHGGTLTLRVLPSQMDNEPALTIEVVDTGCGIPAENLPHVMDPFFTTKEEGQGTGLGLAICRRIVQDHHGRIEIESVVGQGTLVRVQLPIHDEANVRGLRWNETRTTHAE